MHWKILLRGAVLYREKTDWDSVYVEFMRGRPGELPEPDQFDDEAAGDIIRFLNRWATRSPMRAHQLVAAYREVFPLLKELKDVPFEELAVPSHDNTRRERLGCVVEEVFEKISTCGTRRESTGASKILHVLLPETFVMWDMRIAGGYGLCRDETQPRPNGRDYARTFLPRLGYEVDEALASYAYDRRVGRGEAGDALTKESECRSLAKLVDEFNYAKFTLSAEDLWQKVP